MRKRRSYIIVCVMLLVMLLLSFSVVDAAEDKEPKLQFAGMTLEARDDDTVQGFLGLYVSNVQNMGVGFTLQYDSRYVQVSDAKTNEPVEDWDIFLGDDPGYINWTSDDFNAGTFSVDYCEVNPPSGNESYIGDVHFDIFVNQYDDSAGFDYGMNITTQVANPNTQLEETVYVIDSMNKTVKLGGISFNIVDPQGFAKLSKEELKKVFRVAVDEEGANIFEIVSIDNSSATSRVVYDKESNLAYSFEIVNSIARVMVDDTSKQTNAAEIYESGDKSDLLAWMNLHMRDVTVYYADGTRISDSIEWTADCTVTPDYSPKGGTYTVAQKYNDDVNVKTEVTVSPVKAIGLADLDDHINYASVDLIVGDDAKVALSLPDKANVLFDMLVPGKTDNVSVALDSDGWQCVLLDGTATNDLLAIKTGGVGTYEYSTSAVDNPQLPIWATNALTDEDKVTVLRSVGEMTALPAWPTDFTAKVEGASLIIEIKSINGVVDLRGYEFDVRLPGGLVLEDSMFTDPAENYKVETSENGAKITITAEDSADGAQVVLRQSINLGKRLGKFALAAKAPDKMRSGWAEFVIEPRENRYLPGGESDGSYKFDYSKLSQLMSVKVDEELPTMLALPQGDAVNITYSGLDGLEPGILSTISVDSWTLSGTMTVGEPVTYTGKLKDGCYYADHGAVYNTGNVQVRLVLVVTAANDDEQEMLDSIPDVVFAKMQEGYGEYETCEVTLKNIGTSAIRGLSVMIEPKSGSEGAFALLAEPTFELGIDGETKLVLRRNLGLTAGTAGATTYSAVVKVGYNDGNGTAGYKILQTFNVSVTIVSGAVYKVELAVEPDGAGTVTGDGGYAYGETVAISASPVEDSNGDTDYEFEQWLVTNGAHGVTFSPSAQQTNVSFAMPDLSNETVQEIKITAKFKELDSAVLRLKSLQVFNPDDTENNLLLKNKDSGKYEKKAFEPLTRSYFVIAPDGANMNRVEFVLADETPKDKVDVSIYWDGKALAAENWSYNSADGKYTVNTPELSVMPTVNTLTVKLARNDTSTAVERSYTLIIMRKLSEEQMLPMNYGNSPFGLIMQAAAKDTTKDADAWKAEFREGNCFVAGADKMGVPDGGTLGVVYHPDAWGSASYLTDGSRDVGNLDRDDYALFVYQGDTVIDPGFGNVRNSLGEAVDSDKVSATIYNLVALPTKSGGAKENLVSTFKDGTTLDPMTVDGKSKLSDRIRPGVYYISYEFVDYNGEKLTMNRPLIVLYKLGDVDMSGAVDTTDEQYIANRYNLPLPGNLSGYESNCRIYQCRICDANRDRNINVGDRNAIRKGGLQQFYK